MNVIQIENLWKEYRLGVISHGTLSRDLQSWWARLRGKEDPNSKLQPMLAGQEKQIEGDHFWALRDINLEVKEGEILGIIGRNGAGKSTLLKLLSRITAPTKGQIKVKGRIASLLEVGTGFHPELTGRENIFMNGAILGMSKKEIKSKLDEIIDFSGIEQFIDTPVKRYSSGMYVRLAFAVAAHLEPEILIIDEVLAVGDADFQKKCLGKIGEVSKDGRTVLYVSHNMPSIAELCSNCITLRGGEIIFSGSAVAGTERYSNNFYCQDEEQKTDVITLNSVNFLETANEREVLIDKPVIISVNFTCNLDGRYLSPDINLFNASGTMIFCSHQIYPIITVKGKTYKSVCVIPENFLQAGFYHVDFAVVNPDPFEIYSYHEKVKFFKVKETRTGETSCGKIKVHIPGIVSPKLNWSTIEEENV
jgi:lipopolysaccharide transport system ATP-binding protein